MQTNRNLLQVKTLVFALSALCFTAGLASAESGPAAFEGKFRLPFEVRWGSAVLPAGDYTFTLQSASLPAVIALRGEAGSASAAQIMAQATAQRASSDRSGLVLVRSGGKGLVRSLYLADLGLVLYYQAPKAVKPVIAQGPEMIQRVEVTRAGK